jgi:hypothetical protein
MGKTNLVSAKVYLTVGEFNKIKALADDEAVTVSAVLRARLGLKYISRGAPLKNQNRTGGSIAKVVRQKHSRYQHRGAKKDAP